MTNIDHLSESVEKGRIQSAEDYMNSYHGGGCEQEEPFGFECVPCFVLWYATLEGGMFDEICSSIGAKQKGLSKIVGIHYMGDQTYVIKAPQGMNRRQLMDDLEKVYVPF